MFNLESSSLLTPLSQRGKIEPERSSYNREGINKQLTLRMHIAIDCFGRRPSVRFSLSLSLSAIPTIITTQEVKRLQQHTYRLAPFYHR